MQEPPEHLGVGGLGSCRHKAAFPVELAQACALKKAPPRASLPELSTKKPTRVVGSCRPKKARAPAQPVRACQALSAPGEGFEDGAGGGLALGHPPAGGELGQRFRLRGE